jgi:hypothetical protein
MEDGEQHKGAVGNPFGVEAGSAGAHHSLSTAARAGGEEPAAGARAEGRRSCCRGQ